MRLLVLLLLGLWAFPAASIGLQSGPSPSQLCRGAIAVAERASGVPARLMQAIGVVESGRRDEFGVPGPWPWTINAEGVGSYFSTKAEAIAAVTALRARGVRSIDVGCMQVNLMHHADAFATLDEAFDPITNARYAARFLQRLFAQTGSWPGAAAGYHSLTPEIGAPYARKVLAVWNAPDPQPQPGAPTPAFTTAPFATAWSATGKGWGAGGIYAPVAPAGTGLSLGGSSTARIIPLAGSTVLASSGGPMGRSLDSYRAAPTSVAARFTPGRG